MEYILEIQTVEGRCFVILNQARYIIGRSKSNSIVIKDPQVSRYHATLIRKRNEYLKTYEYTIFDGVIDKKKSRNGLIINQKLYRERILETKDIIKLGSNIKLKYYRASKRTLNLLRISYKNDSSISNISGEGIDIIPSSLKRNEENTKIDISSSFKKTITRLNSFDYEKELEILSQKYKI